MAAIRLGLIWRYLRPHRRVLLGGVLALVVVNLLSVTIPLMVRGIIDDLQDGLTVSYVLLQAGWIVLLASLMGGGAADFTPAGVRRGTSGGGQPAPAGV